MSPPPGISRHSRVIESPLSICFMGPMLWCMRAIFLVFSRTYWVVLERMRSGYEGSASRFSSFFTFVGRGKTRKSRPKSDESPGIGPSCEHKNIRKNSAQTPRPSYICVSRHFLTTNHGVHDYANVQDRHVTSLS